MLQDAILKLGPLPRLLNDISVALRNPQLHMPTNHQPDRPKDRLFSRPSFNRLMSSDFQSLMMRDLNRYLLMVSFIVIATLEFACPQRVCSRGLDANMGNANAFTFEQRIDPYFTKTMWLVIITNKQRNYSFIWVQLTVAHKKAKNTQSVAQNQTLVYF